MKRKFSGSAVPRHYVFVLDDGTFVVQWSDKKVQDILSGDVLTYDQDQFGHQVTDGELLKLKAAGRVEHYTQRYIWLYALPERGRFGRPFETLGRASDRVRAFYIITPIPESELDRINDILLNFELTHAVFPVVRNEKIALFGDDQQPFEVLQDAEDTLQQLVHSDSDMFYGSSIALVEVPINRLHEPDSEFHEPVMSLDMLIRSQMDSSVTAGELAVLVGDQYRKDKEAIQHMLEDSLKMHVVICDSAYEALTVLEDMHPAVAIIDLELPDIHGWSFVKKIREIPTLNDLAIMIVSDNPADEVFALKVAKVSAYLSRPVNLKRLREKIWVSLKESSNGRTPDQAL